MEPITVSLLTSTLSSKSVRDLFTQIVTRRVADLASLKSADPNADQALVALEDADLIGANSNKEKYFVTSKGLKIARDLQTLVTQ